MAKRIVKCQINDEYVIGSGVPIGAAGSHDDVVLKLDFNDSWIGLNIYATFRDALGGHPTVVLLLPSMLADQESMIYEVTVPAAAKLYAGKAMLTLTGYTVSDDGAVEESATNTATAYFPVLPSDYAFAEDGSITPTIAQQLQDEMRIREGDISDELEAMQKALDALETKCVDDFPKLDSRVAAAEGNAQSAKEIAELIKAQAEAGAFNGAQGEKGDTGAVKIIPVTALPTESAEENAIYLVPSESSDEENVYDEYVYVDGAWEKLSGAGVAVNLEEYLKKPANPVRASVVTMQAVGTVGTSQLVHEGATPWSVPCRDDDGCVKVAAPKADLDAATKKYVDDALGDIEAALDGIIAIQESLISGGVGSIIAFTLYYENDDVTTALEAEKGMTWREWIDSGYNTIGAYATADFNVVCHPHNGETHYIYHTYDLENTIHQDVDADDVIEEGHQYVCKYFGQEGESE